MRKFGDSNMEDNKDDRESKERARKNVIIQSCKTSDGKQMPYIKPCFS